MSVRPILYYIYSYMWLHLCLPQIVLYARLSPVDKQSQAQTTRRQLSSKWLQPHLVRLSRTTPRIRFDYFLHSPITFMSTPPNSRCATSQVLYIFYVVVSSFTPSLCVFVVVEKLRTNFVTYLLYMLTKRLYK